MKLIPLEPTGRAALGCRCGYAVRTGTRKSRCGALFISIHPDLIRKLGWKRDQIVRLDGDLKEGVARLTPVAVLSRAARKMKLTSTGRGAWEIPWSSLVAEAFPRTTSMVELGNPDVSSEGLLFELPQPEKKGVAKK